MSPLESHNGNGYHAAEKHKVRSELEQYMLEINQFDLVDSREAELRLCQQAQA